MELFVAFAILIALALLLLCVFREHLKNSAAFRKAFTNLIIAVVAFGPAAEVFGMIPGAAIALHLVCRVVGYIFLLLSFRQLYLAAGAPLEDPAPPSVK